ncbi:hypothetical protein MVEG_08568 [Podila verticillata NRRL 6337]|nr:hypothetical protein MVEG_08568 [Podila verticillata NRRL 6337]
MMLHPGSQPHPSNLVSDQDSEANARHHHGHYTQLKHSPLNSCSPASIAAANKKQGDYLTALAIMRPRVLDYDVHSCSSYSALYLPENIKVNNPQDQSSRWSSGSNNQMQYIMIKLKTMAIAHTITFGKYHKLHVCNLKEFKVFGGLTSSNMTELLHTGLRNDHEPETFLLKHKTNSIVFPCQYIKIVPMMAWGPNFNFSVWHVEVKGIPDPELVQETYFQYINFRETESVRLCLKHFRQRKLFDAFKALQERTNIQLEDPLLTSLHRELVVKGNFKRAEELMAKAAERGLFDEYIRAYDYKPIWKRLRSNSHRNGLHHHHHSHQSNVIEDSPRHRGGHQMCIDTKGGYVYLMGGWDGARDLADFWAYHISSQKWILISADTAQQGGPGARSCHKICYSPQHRALFLLGKYVDPVNRNLVDLSSDFWRFDIDPQSPPHGRWVKICANTAAMDGPELIYDHQMCLDPLSQTLYVFGGRVVQLDNDIQHYSGLYSYHIPTNFWKLLRADGHPPPKQDGTTVLRSRVGHSMLYDEMMRGLVIFAGQMNKDYLSDFYVYDIAADRVIEVCKDYNKQGGPEAGFTQRATISSSGREVYVLSGLVKDRALGAEKVKNSFWVFKLPGQDQMDAIRDVQYALKNARSTGSIGSLKSIMNHGRSLSEQYDLEGGDGTSAQAPSSSSRPSTSRRKIHDEKNSGERSGVRPRRGSARSGPSTGSVPNAQARSFISTSNLANEGGARINRQDAMENLRRLNMKGIRPEGTRATTGSASGLEASSSAKSPTPNSLPLPSAEPNHHSTTSTRRQSSSNPATASSESPVSNEPMSLAYVLSDQGSWQKIFQYSNPELGEPSESEPVPRYAHQLVYDDVNEVQYLFGGNPGEHGNSSKRLDDFWELRLYRPKPEQIVRKAKYLLRTQQFKELCQRPETSVLTSTTGASPTMAGQATQAPVSEKVIAHHHANRRSASTASSRRARSQGKQASRGLIERGTPAHHEQSMRALKFLQTELSCVVDQTNKVESEDFKTLIRGLLVGAFSATTGISSATSLLGKTSSSSSIGSKSSHSGDLGNPQKTNVILSPSPVTSPALSNTRMLMSSPSSLSSFAANGGTGPQSLRAFLASPNGHQLSIPVFDNRREENEVDEDSDVDVNDDQLAPGNGQDNGTMGRREDEDSPMMDSSMASRRPVRGSRGIAGRRPSAVASSRTVTPSDDLSDLEGLDHNGDLVTPALEGSEKEDGMDDQVMVDSEHRDGYEDEDESQTEDDDDEEETYANEEEEQVMKAFYRDRTILYEKLLEFFADDVKQPKGDLADLVKVG